MGWKCAVYVQGKEATCTVMTYAMGIQLLWPKATTVTVGLFMGCMWKKKKKYIQYLTA
jgi:hypothetical protein